MMQIQESLRDIASGNRTGGRMVDFSTTMLDAADCIDNLKKALKLIADHPVDESGQFEVAVKEMKKLADKTLKENY